MSISELILNDSKPWLNPIVSNLNLDNDIKLNKYNNKYFLAIRPFLNVGNASSTDITYSSSSGTLPGFNISTGIFDSALSKGSGVVLITVRFAIPAPSVGKMTITLQDPSVDQIFSDSFNVIAAPISFNKTFTYIYPLGLGFTKAQLNIYSEVAQNNMQILMMVSYLSLINSF